jgi:hypothetical protein
MKTRTTVSAAELYVILDREFRLRRSKGCDACYITLPFRVDRHDEGSANWEVLLPADCQKGCGEVLDALVARYADVYELVPERSDVDPSLH